MNNEAEKPLWTIPYFLDLIEDAVHCWLQHAHEMGYEPEHLSQMLTKAELLERWIDPVITERINK